MSRSSRESNVLYSLHFKLILSYLALIAIVGIISVSFIYIFSNGYIRLQTCQKLSENAEEFAREAALHSWEDSTEITDLQIIFRREMDSNVSLVLTDAAFSYIPESGMNVDLLETSPEQFVSYLSRYRDRLGASVVHFGDTAYAVSIQQVYNASTESVLGYVVLFTVPASSGMQNYFLTLYLLSLGTACVMAIAVALLFSSGLTRNLRRLKIRADQVANRQFESSFEPIHSGDEIEDLALSIDRMAKSLSEYDAQQKKFLQNASHELRTPLMSIRGYVEGMKDGVFSDVEDVGDHVLEQVDRLEKLTGDLIYLSKIETADEVFSKTSVLVSDLIEESFSRVSGFPGLDGVCLERGRIADMRVYVDPDAMVTAITNLISNAFRFAKSRIEVSSYLKDGMVVISVQDDGPGISSEDLDHIFDRFYKGKQGKYGLGLSIVNAIAVAHEGMVHAYNRVGKNGETGAIFEIILKPCKKQ